MGDPRCGAHCGDGGIGECFTCEIHGLCHMCVEEDWAGLFGKLRAENERLAQRIHDLENPDGAPEYLNEVARLESELGHAVAENERMNSQNAKDRADWIEECRGADERAEAWEAAAEALAEYASISNPTGPMCEVHAEMKAEAVALLKAARKLDEGDKP